MSLVAYAASSDEESDSNEETGYTLRCTPAVSKTTSETICDEHISDEDDDFTPVMADLKELRKAGLSLPAPKNPDDGKTLSQELESSIAPAFAKLPTPKSCSGENSTQLKEEDDEFLHKKPVPSANAVHNKPIPPARILKCPVQIAIPSMKEYSDVDKEIAHKAKSKVNCLQTPKASGLLSILPKAKSEQDFSKVPTGSVFITNPTVSNVPTLIPDTVKNKRPARNTEFVDRPKIINKKSTTKEQKHKTSLVDCSDSDDDSDTEMDSSKDFFSLKSAETLPEISVNEINLMVANRAAKMAEAKDKYLNCPLSHEIADEKAMNEEEQAKQEARKRYYEQQNIDTKAVQALVGGSNAKRRKQQQEIQIMDISGEEVMPNRDEWMRTALASSTAYQPTGVLVDEEPATGTRRKHQITYLAHKAKANEAELQAMWSANRQTRRITQSKYGF